MNTGINAMGILAQLLVAGVLIVAYIVAIAWTYWDAESRGKSGCLVALMVFLLTLPIGLIVWLVFRPAVKQPRQE